MKDAKYKRIFDQVTKLVAAVTNPYSRMSTIIALLHAKQPNFFWTGFYLLDNGELLVGPYQGSLACLRLAKNKGVCWAAINQQKTIIVPDVEKFPGHIACSALSKSEIVIPLFFNDKVVGCFDIDSRKLNEFDEVDGYWLQQFAALVFEGVTGCELNKSETI